MMGTKTGEKLLKCILRCIAGTHEDILLPDNEAIIIGRGPQTKIKDKRCSRSQVELTANHSQNTVIVKQLGGNQSAVNGVALKPGRTATLGHDDRFELLEGEYPYQVVFVPLTSKRTTDSNQVVTSESMILGSEQTEDMPLKKKTKLNESVKEGEKYKNESEKRGTADTKSVPVKLKLDSAGGGAPVSGSDKWEDIDNGKLMIFTGKGVECRSKVAAYDMDWTIISTKSGKVFPANRDDWQIMLPEIPGKLKQLWRDGFKIVFVTNQAGISRGKMKPQDFKFKAEAIISKLGVPVQVFCSTGRGVYRKPATTMWDLLVETRNGGVKVDLKTSFLCGDAAGREANWAPKKKKDFSCSDRLMALNIGVQFLTPEEHFQGHKPIPYKMPEFNPGSVDVNMPLCDDSSAQITSGKQEAVIMVGFPGSGKTHVVTTHLVPRGYVHVNRDTLKSWQKCLGLMEKSLSAGKSIVIDNTNPDVESRKRYVEVARKLNVSCRCFVMKASIHQSKHNNKFREFIDDSHDHVSDIVFNMYKSKYQDPTIDEGFAKIVRINFIPKFQNSEHDKLYRMYLLEK